MTKDEIKSTLDTITSKGLLTGLIFYVSPLTGEIEERHIYADSQLEVEFWAGRMMDTYADAPYMIYVNRHLYQTKKDIGKYIK